MTLVPPKDLPRLLLPMADQLKRLLPGRSLPLPAEAQRIGDDWRIPAKDLAASPDGSWAKAATGGLQCRLVEADSRRATIEIILDTPLGSQKALSGSGKMVVNLSTGVLESFRLRNSHWPRLQEHLEPTPSKMAHNRHCTLPSQQLLYLQVPRSDGPNLFRPHNRGHNQYLPKRKL